MKALLLEKGSVTLAHDHPRPTRAPGEALVRVLAAGICNTDLELLRGYMGFEGVPGHEFVGIVEEADTESLVGKRVIGEINASCGECALCMEGIGRHCARRTVLGIAGRDGAFAECLALPEGNLHLVPDSLTDEEATFVEPVAAAMRILEQVTLDGSQRVIVLGDGKLGILIAQVLTRHSHLTLAGHNPKKLAIAKTLGLDACLEDELSESGFDVAVDATGSAGGFDAAANLLKPTGVLVAKTTVAGDVPVALSKLVVNEITVVGSRCGPFGPAIEALSRGEVSVRPLVTATFALEDFEAAFAMARERDTLKVLLCPSGGAS